MLQNNNPNVSLMNRKDLRVPKNHNMLYQLYLNQKNLLNLLFQNYYLQSYRKYFSNQLNYLNFFCKEKVNSKNNLLYKNKKIISEEIHENKINIIGTNSIDKTISSYNINNSSKIENNNVKKDIQKKKIKNNNEDRDIEKDNKGEKTDIVKNKSNEVYEGNPLFENIVILNVEVKISKDKTVIFKLRRYDDIFETIKLFCEINSVNEKLIKPIIIKSLSTLNTIYQIMN